MTSSHTSVILRREAPKNLVEMWGLNSKDNAGVYENISFTASDGVSDVVSQAVEIEVVE